MWVYESVWVCARVGARYPACTRAWGAWVGTESGLVGVVDGGFVGGGREKEEEDGAGGGGGDADTRG